MGGVCGRCVWGYVSVGGVCGEVCVGGVCGDM